MRIRTASVTAVCLVLLAAGPLLAGCAADTAAAGTQPAGTQSAADHKAPVGLGSAEQVAAYLEQGISAMATSVVYTSATDPDHLLGKAGGYQSKAAFTDSRIQPGEVTGTGASPVDLGGVIETYATVGQARARAQHLAATLQGLAASEYHYYVGASLIRVSRILTPSQAADYQQAAESLG
ncbi:hypothetical protein [Actinacidiphila acidipaludis]|uniref:Lipoprotein n=1 Tax=Actinacidiphila acidipaludis TaxID=2873382 RepID=A0ABS7QAM8_9ACTN|nr:hypothetical protein [Streptomyces acidipaludis]MBY8879784.1 hypothetical protein [Streptomyces acidipaludis]